MIFVCKCKQKNKEKKRILFITKKADKALLCS